MENKVETDQRSGLGEHNNKGFGNVGFELKQDKVYMEEGSNRFKDSDGGDDVVKESSVAQLTCIDTGEKVRPGESLEAAADGLFQEAVDQRKYKPEEDVNIVRDVPEPVHASQTVSEIGVGIEGSNVVIGNEEGEEGALQQKTQDFRPETRQVVNTRAPVPPHINPAGLGNVTPLPTLPYRVQSRTLVNGRDNQCTEQSGYGNAEEIYQTRKKLYGIRVKFLRLANRLGQAQHQAVVRVLHRINLAEQQRWKNGGPNVTFTDDRASKSADMMEKLDKPIDFTCTIMVLGKIGVGKSATINSIFDRVTAGLCGTDAFELGTKKAEEVVGTVQGIKIRVIDTPGLFSSLSDQPRNVKMLKSVQRFIRKSPPDVVLYFDRLDMVSKPSDVIVLRAITDTFGLSIWTNAIIVLTHAASAPPEDANGIALNYHNFVTGRARDVQQAIRRASGNRMLLNPVSLVENHSMCRRNRVGQRVLPDGQVWNPCLLLSCFGSKIIAEANTVLEFQESPPVKPDRARSPLPFFLSFLLQTRPQLKLPNEQYDSDEDTQDDDSMNSDDEWDYDELPPFRHLTKAQLAKLSKSEQKAFYDELEYREELFKKKQLSEEKQKRRMSKFMEANGMPSDYSETTNQWLVRPVHGSQSWDHDVGYEGTNMVGVKMAGTLVINKKVPMSFVGQFTKEKKETHFYIEVAGSVKHNIGQATTLGFNMQQIGNDIAYTLRNDTKFSNFKRNKAVASLSVIYMGDTVNAGVKFEDNIMVTSGGQVVIYGGAIVGHGDVAYGGCLEASLRDQDFHPRRFLPTMSVSLMNWQGDLATRWNAQTQIPVGRLTKLIASVNYDNRGLGQVCIQLKSCGNLQIALVGLIPLFTKLLGYVQQA